MENNKTYDLIILGEDETLLLKATNTYVENKGKDNEKVYPAGSTWLKSGPCDFIPPIEV